MQYPRFMYDPAARAAHVAGWRQTADRYKSLASTFGLSARDQRDLLAEAAAAERAARRVAAIGRKLGSGVS